MEILGKKITLNLRGTTNSDGKFDWTEALIDAGIKAGLAFVTTLGALGATGLMKDPEMAILAAGLAAAMQFFAYLALKRGLMEKPQK